MAPTLFPLLPAWLHPQTGPRARSHLPAAGPSPGWQPVPHNAQPPPGRRGRSNPSPGTREAHELIFREADARVDELSSRPWAKRQRPVHWWTPRKPSGCSPSGAALLHAASPSRGTDFRCFSAERTLTDGPAQWANSGVTSAPTPPPTPEARRAAAVRPASKRALGSEFCKGAGKRGAWPAPPGGRPQMSGSRA